MKLTPLTKGQIPQVARRDSARSHLRRRVDGDGSRGRWSILRRDGSNSRSRSRDHQVRREGGRDGRFSTLGATASLDLAIANLTNRLVRGRWSSRDVGGDSRVDSRRCNRGGSRRGTCAAAGRRVDGDRDGWKAGHCKT